ncbi:response regulator containing a CheY-like receiver domain and an HTH DNA-binding domain [Caulobacter sp. AP07]|nr:response regulator containing a CheY-like receiver domain and an HTH DNA-binding domain [Caulobacter sp. AP07]
MRLAGLIDTLGSETFERRLYAFCGHYASLSVLFAIELEDKGGGRVLLTEGLDDDLTARARKISRDYALEDYADDDVFKLHSRGALGSVDWLLQHAGDREGKIRLKYFDDMDAAEEISIFRRQASSTLYVGLSSTAAGYRPEEVQALLSISPLLVSLVRRHAATVDAGGSNLRLMRERKLGALRRILLQHQAGLTPREADVCAAIVVGYRAEAVAELLGIAANTVATHRKRAYAKLNISSQTELFGIFFAGWET